jgi:hypothetical protein
METSASMSAFLVAARSVSALFGTDDFIHAYNAAVSEHVTAPPKAKAGSFRHLCILYHGSSTFKRLDVATQSWRRRALDAIAEKHGHKPVAQMEARHIRMLRDERDDRPGAANKRLKALKALFAWACEERPDIARQNPTLTVHKIPYASSGHHSWTPQEIEQYRERHSVGTNNFSSANRNRYRISASKCVSRTSGCR